MKTRHGKLMAVLGSFAICAFAYQAQAITFGFDNITHNGPANVASQLKVVVSQSAAQATIGQVQFDIFNAGSVASSITGIYFDDGSLLGIQNVADNPPGVQFRIGGSPSDLPGGDAIVFATTTSADLKSFYSTVTQESQTDWGVNPGEAVGIIFDLQKRQDGSYMDINDTLYALEHGALRIGLYVRAIGQSGNTDSFVNGALRSIGVPDGGITALLLGSVLLGVEGLRRKIRK